jgi:SAM-dependent MidA family methyltransferase
VAPNPLEQLIRDEIARTGPITFARFMWLALYHPEYGYYLGGGHGREPVGWAGDYFTSGDVHPLWGWCLARQAHELWLRMARPHPFYVIEPGAGRGLLARDMWTYALAHAPDWAGALRYVLVERAPAGSPLRLGREQRLRAALDAVHAPPHAVTWVDALAAAVPQRAACCLFANELIDALPTHVVEARASSLAESYVDATSSRLVERAGPLSQPSVATYLDHYAVSWRTFPDGWRAECCLAAIDWMQEAASAVQHGCLFVIDYGDRARALYTRDRRRGTLTAYSQHRLAERLLAHPGEQDLTAHVNFSALIDAGRAAGLRLAGLTTQRDMLLRLGIEQEVEVRAARLYPYADTERHTDRGQRDYLLRAALRNAVATLLRPEGLGGFRVLVMHRGVPGGARMLTALRGASTAAHNGKDL